MKEIGEQSRQRILDAAEELFLEKGYEKTTLADVGKRSGISYGSIPWHFGNKAGLLWAVVDRFISDPSDYVTGSHGKRLETGLPGLLKMRENSDQWEHHPKLILLHMLDASYDEAPEDLVEIVRLRDLEWIKTLTDWVTRSLPPEGLPDGLTAEGVAQFIISTRRGIGVVARMSGDQFQPQQARETLWWTIASLLKLEVP